MSHDERLLELISALVDGELTPDEQSRAEQLLANNADLRLYRDQLMSVRASVQGFPQYKLPGDFAQQVLRRAQCEMLLDRALEPVTVAGKNGHAPRPSNSQANTNTNTKASRSPSPTMFRRWSPWLAFAAGVAAVVAIFVALRSWNQDPRVADNQQQQQGTNVATQENEKRPRTGDAENGLAQSNANGQSDSVETNPPQGSNPLANDRPPTELVENNSSVPKNSTPDSGSPPNSTPQNNVADNNSRQNSLVNPDQNVQIPMFALVVEVVLTSRGIEEDVFEQVLQRNQIEMRNVIALERQMESTLLSHKYFGGIKPEDLPADGGEPANSNPVHNHLELFFVACTGPQLDNLSLDLIDQKGSVITVKLDVASATSDMELYTRMKKLADQPSESDSVYVGAHPMVMEEELRERMLVALRQSKGLDALPALAPRTNEQQEAPRPAVGQMAKEISLVLIVLRSADTVMK